MLKWIIRAILFRTVLKRFWLFAAVYAIARRFLPWEKGTNGDNKRQPGYR